MNHNDSSEYNKLPDNIQKEVCEHFQDKYYPESSLEDIHNAFVDIDPVVKDIEDKSFTVWEAHRASFEKTTRHKYIKAINDFTAKPVTLGRLFLFAIEEQWGINLEKFSRNYFIMKARSAQWIFVAISIVSVIANMNYSSQVEELQAANTKVVNNTYQIQSLTTQLAAVKASLSACESAATTTNTTTSSTRTIPTTTVPTSTTIPTTTTTTTNNYNNYNNTSKSTSRSCCKICTKGKACGDSCISRSYTCHKGPGCACDG